MDNKSKRDFVVTNIRKFLPKMIASTLLGIISGTITVYILSTVNDIISEQSHITLSEAMSYVFACLAAIAAAIYSQSISSRIGFELTSDVRLYLINKIIVAPIESLEQYEKHRLMPILTEDINVISSAFFVLAETLVSFTTIIGCLGYLLTLSPSMSLVVLAPLSIGIGIQFYAQSKGIQGFRRTRKLEDNIHKAYCNIIEGAKELKMNKNRRQDVYNVDIIPTIDSIKSISIKSIRSYISAKALGGMIYFIAIGLVLIFGYESHSNINTISGFAILLIYLKKPIDQILSILPSFGQAKISLYKIFELFDKFNEIDTHIETECKTSLDTRFSSIKLDDLKYENNNFRIGPINLYFNAGEIVFIVGKNGSGKTTLIKLMLGLYQPSGGEILLNGQPINNSNRDDYRQLFATIFSDFYLFDRISNAHEKKVGVDEMMHEYLLNLGIIDKVSVKHGVFNTTNLSSGQRKRLALANAYMEKKSIYVFDEWAADQDPLFRNVFYTKILPELREQGKLIIVVSHDDRYFNIADRLVVLDNGKIVESQAV